MPALRLRALIDVVLVGLVCLACYLMGKDLNIDMLTYHLYSAHAFWHGTYSETYMGAGSQSYINPIGYLPFYWMIRADWHSFAIAATLAAGSATALMLLWRLGYRWLFAGHPHALALSIAGAVLGGLSPLYLATLGTSFLDPLQAALFCLAMYITAIGIERSDNRWLCVGGFVLGLSTGLKLSMVHLCAATLLALLVIPGSPATRIKRLLVGAIGAMAGAILSGGYWAWHLFREYGNPVFPFANAIFRSPDFPPVSLGLDRFAPESWTDVMTLPFRMVALKSGVYAEIAVPDVRLAAALLLSIVCAIAATRARAWTSVLNSKIANVPMYLCAIWILSYLTMVLTSGNGRYFLPLFLLIGPIVVWLTSCVFKSPRLLFGTVILVLAAQAIHGGAANYRRWDSTQWTSRWIDAEVHPSLVANPARYLFAGSESDTFVAAYLHPESRYLMLLGKNPLSPNRAGAERVRSFLNDSRADLRVLVRESETRSSDLYRNSIADPITLALVNDELSAWNLSASDKDCRYVGLTLGSVKPGHGRTMADSAWPREYSMLSCPVVKGSQASQEFRDLQNRLESLSDVLSKSCPALFPAPPSFPTRIGDIWFIRYGGSDVVISSDGMVAALTRTPFGPFNLPIGSLDSLSQGKMSIECNRLPRR